MPTSKTFYLTICSLLIIAHAVGNACLPDGDTFTASALELTLLSPTSVETLVERGVLHRARGSEDDVEVSVSWLGAEHVAQTYWVRNRVLGLVNLDDQLHRMIARDLSVSGSVAAEDLHDDSNGWMPRTPASSAPQFFDTLTVTRNGDVLSAEGRDRQGDVRCTAPSLIGLMRVLGQRAQHGAWGGSAYGAGRAGNGNA